MLTKTEIENLIKAPGQVRGVVFNTDAEYVLREKGEEELRRVEEKTKEWGCPIDYKNIRNMEWYPVGLRVVSLLAIKTVFNWDDEKIKDMGHSAPSHSFVVKLLMKYLLTLKQTYEKSPGYWTKHYTVGELKTPEHNEKEKYLVIRLKEYKFHPIICIYFQGYFQRIAQYVIKSEKFTTEETKCMHRGDLYHEFVVHWQ